MDQGISEIIGRADLGGGKSTQLYRALRPLLCSTCGAEIAEGTLFTRRKMKGIGLRIMPQCRKCAPFTLQSGKKEKSALLQSLLVEEPADSSGRTRASSQPPPTQTHSQTQVAEKSLNEKVRRRLEPALKRGRRGRFSK
jgi:hypothetical protein